MIYLDNAATSMPKPAGVYRAVSRAMRQCASVGRSGHEPARLAAKEAFGCRALASALFDALPDQVVFTMNTTHGMNIAISSLVQPGDRVVISGFEHHAVTRPLYHRRANVTVAGTRLFDQADTLTAFDRAITEETKAVICTHVSNVFGYVLPLEDIASLCREREVPLIVDAAQSAGVLPISMKQLGAAFIAMPGHKGLYGPQGTGLLLCGRQPEPLMQGGTGSQSQLWQMPEFLPDRVEVGTHNVPGIAGLAQGLKFVQDVGLDTIFAKEEKLTKLALEQMREFKGLEVSSGEAQSGVISFRGTVDCELAAHRLAQIGVAVRAGLHCAPLAHRSAGTLQTGTIRLSFSFFNKESDVEELIFGLRKIMN